MKNYDVVIIGGGAGGLFAATLLKGANFALLERGARLGRKLSATGNGQGNVTNTNMSTSRYFTDDGEKLKVLLSRFGQRELIGYLSSLGGVFTPDETGRVYPSSRQASSVTDLLMASRGGETYLDCLVTDVKKRGDGYVIEAAGKEKLTFFAKYVVICVGGKAQKSFGTDGNFYEIFKRLGHSVTPLYPALVQLKTADKDVRALSGTRADVVLTARKGGKVLSKTRGDVLFTDFGISGNAAFFVSSYLSGTEEATLEIEFLPDVPEEDVIEAITAKEKSGRFSSEELLCCIVKNQIGRTVIRRSDGTPRGIVSALKKFTLAYTGTLGFDYAQVTRGGVPFGEVNSDMESAFNKNLFICGEALNVDGECGGYNLQFAFSSAYAAAEAIKERLK